MKNKNGMKKPPAKVKKVAPAGISKKKKPSSSRLNIHAMGRIWTPPSSGKDIVNTPDKTTNEKKKGKAKVKKNCQKESSKEPGHLLKTGIKFSSQGEFSSNKKSEKKNTNLNEKPKKKSSKRKIIQTLKWKRDKKLKAIKKLKGEEVSSPSPQTGVVNPAFNNSVRDAQTDFSPKSSKKQSSSGSIKEVNVSTTDNVTVHQRNKNQSSNKGLKEDNVSTIDSVQHRNKNQSSSGGIKEVNVSTIDSVQHSKKNQPSSKGLKEVNVSRTDSVHHSSKNQSSSGGIKEVNVSTTESVHHSKKNPPSSGGIKEINVSTADSVQHSSQNQPSSGGTKEVDVSTTDSVHHRLKKDKLKELLTSTAENGPMKSIEPIESTDSKGKKKRKSPFDTAIFDKAKERLASSRFRYINELIYTQTSEQSAKMFKKDPLLFKAYHQGFQQQAKAWKMDPLDMIIDQVKMMPKTSVIADMGCGDARLAKSIKRLVHSFDLVSNAPGVIQCDMSKVPLPDESVDVVVFCLSLMGTNIKEFLLEASRILKEDGLMKIAELESRLQQDKDFIKNMVKYGFTLKKKNLKEEYFVFYDFIKEREPNSRNNLPVIELKPCLYKKR